MTIFIIGAGFTGMQLAKMLVLERNKVVLIDNDAALMSSSSPASPLPMLSWRSPVTTRST